MGPASHFKRGSRINLDCPGVRPISTESKRPTLNLHRSGIIQCRENGGFPQTDGLLQRSLIVERASSVADVKTVPIGLQIENGPFKIVDHTSIGDRQIVVALSVVDSCPRIVQRPTFQSLITTTECHPALGVQLTATAECTTTPSRETRHGDAVAACQFPAGKVQAR